MQLMVSCYLIIRRAYIEAEFCTAKICLAPQGLRLALALKTGRQTSIKEFEN